ncbi:hypothetical protein [Proteiniphilum sp. UBA5384]|uniref:hypothetical protein n=1 Tax=Proteiniphilum sp. UBA5384 TaxID=1947279 RepID=UPI0025E26D3F|nr:hypothetical protein [Proteiniphilum sp. UBA5384]
MSDFTFEPHSHDFEELVICKTGMIEHLIDFERSRLIAPLVCFVSKGKILDITV